MPPNTAGDFNAWAVDWESQRSNKRVSPFIILDAFSTLDIVLVN